MRRIKVFMMVLLISLILVSSSIPALASDTTVKDTMNIDQIETYPEVPEKRTEYAKAYKTSEDTITYIVDSQKIHFKNEKGIWQDVNNDIIPYTGEIYDYGYVNKANDYIMMFGMKDGKASSRISKDKYSVEFIMHSDESINLSKLNKLELLGTDNEYLNKINNQNNSIIYKNALDNSDLVYTVNGDRLKEDIVLYSKPNFSTISYSLKCTNLEFKKSTKEYIGYDEDTGAETKSIKEMGIFYDPETGDEIFLFQDLFMMDSANHYCGDLKWDYIKDGNEYFITLYLDKEFLDSNYVKYPVIIDPTVSGPSVTFDTYASKLNPSTNYYLLDYLRTGCDAPYGVRRTFINWTLPIINEERYPITYAEIQLYKHSSAGATDLIAKRLTTSWSSSSLTWSNSPNYTDVYSQDDGYWNGSWYQIDIREICRRWYCGMYGGYGIKLQDNIENNVNVWTTFRSSDYSSSSYHPKLVIGQYTGTSAWITYSGKYYTNTVRVDNNMSSYSSEFINARDAWNSSGADCTIISDSNSNNSIEIDTTISGTGLYVPGTAAPVTQFDIFINPSNMSIEWNHRVKGTIVHELGHALGLGDIETGQYIIMGYSRDFNSLIEPAASDINGVNTIW